MTSNPKPTSCYVYITLPGETHPLTAGRFDLSLSRSGAPSGRFVYGKAYLANSKAVPFDPVELKLVPRAYETSSLNGIFGALRDASPDYWGRRVIEKHCGQTRLSEMDYLLNSPDDRAGALGFGLNPQPPAPLRRFNQSMDLAKLQNLAAALLENSETSHDPRARQVEEFLLLTSMGGARPKAVIERPDGLWLAKFNRADDRWNTARVEHSMLVLARECGITAAQSEVTQVGGRDVLLVKRFDRTKSGRGYTRARMVSGLTLLRADENITSRKNWSYILLAEELRVACTQGSIATEELFKRMCFNALISNSDDHPRNHALLAPAGDWQLSPAYDLTPSAATSSERRDLALEIGKAGRFASFENLMSECLRFGLPRARAEKIYGSMEEQVRNTWYTVSRSCGVNESDCGLISGSFNYPGLRLGALAPS